MVYGYVPSVYIGTGVVAVLLVLQVADLPEERLVDEAVAGADGGVRRIHLRHRPPVLLRHVHRRRPHEVLRRGVRPDHERHPDHRRQHPDRRRRVTEPRRELLEHPDFRDLLTGGGGGGRHFPGGGRGHAADVD